jgi:hypothetical protein
MPRIAAFQMILSDPVRIEEIYPEHLEAHNVMEFNYSHKPGSK